MGSLINDHYETSIHEAGHCVAAWVIDAANGGIGYAFNSVSVLPDKRWLGAACTGLTAPHGIEYYKQEAVICYAGAAAQSKVTDDSDRVRLGAADDYAQAAECCRKAGVTQEEIQAEAEGLIADNWPLVEALAGVLAEKLWLGGDEVDWILVEGVGSYEADFLPSLAGQESETRRRAIVSQD